MSPALVAIVLAICAGAVIAVSSRDSGVAAIGIAIALVAAALLTDPLPSAPILGVRVVAALLVATIIRSALSGGPRQPSPLGWPAEALLATAGAVAGLGLAVGLAALGGAGGPPVGIPGPAAPVDPVTPVDAAITGMALIVAAATALLAVGIPPMVHGRAGGRRAIGLVLVTEAVLLLRIGFAGPAVDLEEVARAALLVVSAATGAALAAAAARARSDAGFDDDVEVPPPGGRRAAGVR